ncbi:hypothetical protein SDC9_186063 [bioreactor metagenome]|uniref:Tripartite ATP-independent periplasmic transporters DctQ component domain-containing protein n=1 Tax=bioreactor metagenome TaxID=1076179 RepID=A0A645HK16_9ZZZZ
MSRYLFIWVSFLGAVAAYKENRHVGVTLLTDNLKGVSLIVVKTLGYIALFFTLGIMLWGSIIYTKTTAASLGAATGIPFGYMAVSLTFATIGIIGIIAKDAILYYRRLIENKKGGQK